MTDKITNIEESHELVNPKFLTTTESCLKMLDKASENKKFLENYIYKVHDKINKLALDKIKGVNNKWKL